MKTVPPECFDPLAAFLVACGVHRLGRFLASASSTAMRTATPISTWSRITTARVVGDGGGDLDAAVHRARVHDDGVGLGARELLLVEAEEVEVFARRGHVGALHALALQAQHHDDVDAFESLPHVGEDFRAEPLGPRRQQRRGRGDAHARAERIQHVDVGAGDAAVQDVAADGHREPGDAPLDAADRQRVEQRLRRMLVGAVAGVDHRAVDLLRRAARPRPPHGGAPR